MNILFLTRYDYSGASSRFRVFQYEQFLNKCGVETFIFPLSVDTYSIRNKLFKRLRQMKLYRVMSELFWLKIINLIEQKDPDIVFVQKVPFTPSELKIIKRLKKKLIYDIDDAIFLRQHEQESNSRELHEFQQRQKYFGEMLNEYNHIIVGNEFLKQYVIKFNSSVTIIPTAVDTDKFTMRRKINNNNLIIGWIGTANNLHYLNNIEDVLGKLCIMYPYVKVKVVCDNFIDFERLKVEKKEWKLKDEINDIQSFDIGIMPLPDNDWARGKCGFKILQYMASGIPVVCSPIGMNIEIVKDDTNGFLANTSADWYNKLSQLIENPKLRERFAKAGRETVEGNYSLTKVFPIFYNTLNEVYLKQ